MARMLLVDVKRAAAVSSVTASQGIWLCVARTGPSQRPSPRAVSAPPGRAPLTLHRGPARTPIPNSGSKSQFSWLPFIASAPIFGVANSRMWGTNQSAPPTMPAHRVPGTERAKQAPNAAPMATVRKPETLGSNTVLRWTHPVAIQVPATNARSGEPQS